MEIGILGPLQVRIDGRTAALTGSRLRALLTRLALDAPAVVSVNELVDALWPADPPGDPTNALQSLVSRVRRALGAPGVIQQVAGGYQLTVDRGAVDATAFADLAVAGRRELRGGASASARDTLTKALALWRGDPLPDAGDAVYAAAPIARLLEQRIDAQSDLVEAELRLDGAVEIVGEIEALVLRHPLREDLTGQLIRALAAVGRTADALAAYDRLRERLADELGVDPGAELQDLHLAALRGEIAPALPFDRVTTGAGQRRSNLRATLTSFIGRDGEIARVSGLLGTARLVTVVGPGGAGKTRLANEVARQWISRRSDGVWLVELAPVSDDAAIAQAMLGALGQLDTRAVERNVERQVRPSIDQLLDLLADSDCLLLIDNCEHLIGPVAAMIDLVLARCPDVLIVATSREPLGIGGEALCVLPPLRLPPVDISADEAMGFQAVRLFVDRAQAVSAGFTVDEASVAAVTDIVRRLDGLPLAIELAAARLRVMPVAEIETRLSDRFRLLTGGSRTAMPRHRTLRAVVEWSWDLLSAPERLLAERLAVFPAGTTVESAVAVCSDGLLPAADISDLLLSLVDKSLLTVIDAREQVSNSTAATETRYRMLETIREYGVDRLAERGEAQDARTAHARHFAAVAAWADPLLRQAGQLAAIAVLEAERDNILAALRFLADSDDAAARSASLDMALSLTWYWTMIGANSDAAEWLGRALEATGGIDHPGRIWARAARAITTMFEGAQETSDIGEIQAELRELGGELRAAGEPPTPSLAILKPMLAYFGDDVENADAAMAEVLQSPDGWLRAAARISRAWFAENEGDMSSIREDMDAAFQDMEPIGDRWGLSSVLSARGAVRAMDGDLAGAIADNERAGRLAAELGSTDDAMLVRLRLAGLYLRAGEVQRARRAIKVVRAEFAGHSQGVERTMFADGVLLAIEMQDGNLDLAVEIAADLRRRLAAHPPSHIQAHAAAIVGATTAVVAVRSGDLNLALSDLTANFPLAVLTGDMPILAAVGVSVAHLTQAARRPSDAAAVLGAAAQLRGSADLSDPLIAELTQQLRSELGDDYDAAFDAGRTLGRAAAIARIDPAPLTAWIPARQSPRPAATNRVWTAAE